MPTPPSKLGHSVALLRVTVKYETVAMRIQTGFNRQTNSFNVNALGALSVIKSAHEALDS